MSRVEFINRKTFFYLLALFLFWGCEKLIDVDLNESNPALVIQGNLTRSPGLSEVKITKTGSYFSESPETTVSGAIVKITNNLGNVFLFEEKDLGLYKSHDTYPQEGTIYTLSVEVKGETYQATSKLNKPVLIDSLSYKYEEGFAFFDDGYTVTMHFSDPPGIQNYYRIKMYRNGVYNNNSNNLIIFDDRLVDGNSFNLSLGQFIYDAGDTANVELISLDESAYEYYRTFQELVNTNPGSAAPANPTSNFSNGALGYFSAWSSDSKTIEIKEISN